MMSFQKLSAADASKCMYMWEWFNPVPHTEAFYCLCSRPLMQTLSQKEKLLKISNFTLWHNVGIRFVRYPLLSGFSSCLSVCLFVKQRSTAQTDGPIPMKLGEHVPYGLRVRAFEVRC